MTALKIISGRFEAWLTVRAIKKDLGIEVPLLGSGDKIDFHGTLRIHTRFWRWLTGKSRPPMFMYMFRRPSGCDTVEVDNIRLTRAGDDGNWITLSTTFRFIDKR